MMARPATDAPAAIAVTVLEELPLLSGCVGTGSPVPGGVPSSGTVMMGPGPGAGGARVSVSVQRAPTALHVMGGLVEGAGAGVGVGARVEVGTLVGARVGEAVPLTGVTAGCVQSGLLGPHTQPPVFGLTEPPPQLLTEMQPHDPALTAADTKSATPGMHVHPSGTLRLCSADGIGAPRAPHADTLQ